MDAFQLLDIIYPNHGPDSCDSTANAIGWYPEFKGCRRCAYTDIINGITNYGNEYYYDTCPYGDRLIRILADEGKISKKQSASLSVQFSERVLPVYEGQYPNKWPRRAIESAKKWLADPSDVNRSVVYEEVMSLDAGKAFDAWATRSRSNADLTASAIWAYWTVRSILDSDAFDAAVAASQVAAWARAYCLSEQEVQVSLIHASIPNPWRIYGENRGFGLKDRCKLTIP